MLTDSSGGRDPVERLAEEFLERRRRGEDVAIDDYADRYPEHADRIRAAFPAVLLMERLRPGSADLSGTSDGTDGPGEKGEPERLGDYRIVREVGRGGMGVVYEAIQESLGRHVALKVLSSAGRIDSTYRERFRLEARSAARLHHTHIVPVYGVGEHGGVQYYAMQFIPGCGLDAVLDDLRKLKAIGGGAATPLILGTATVTTLSESVARSLVAGGTEAHPRAEPSSSAHAGFSVDGSGLSATTDQAYFRAVARLGVQVAEALDHAHSQGVIHRDIKPSNLLLDADGKAWVTDFGLAKVEGSDGPTRTGDIVGTLRYMAPERFDGWSDPRSDVYGLGVTLYEMLTLRPAHDAQTRARLIEKVLHEPPPPPRKIDPRVPRDLETVVLKAMAREPGDRYPSAHALAEDLENFLSGKPIRARRAAMPERVWRWCRRNPIPAALCGVSGIAALALVGLVVGWSYNAQLKEESRKAVEARGAEEVQRRRAEAEFSRAKTYLYYNHIALAAHAWQGGSVANAERHLEECPPELRGWEWGFLGRNCHPELMTLRGHRNEVWGVAYSPDGRLIASASVDRTLRIWDASTGELAREIPLSTMGWSVAFSPDGRRVATVSAEPGGPGQVTLWDVETGREIRSHAGLNGNCARLAFSPDGSRIAISSGLASDEKVAIWETEAGGDPLILRGHEEAVSCVAFSPDGRYLATGTGRNDTFDEAQRPGVIRIWEVKSGTIVRTIAGHSKGVLQVTFSPRGDLMASASRDATVRLWKSSSGEMHRVLRGHTDSTTDVAFRPDGEQLVSCGDDTTVRVWDAAEGTLLATLRGHTLPVASIAYHHGGDRIVSCSYDRTVKVWDPASDPQARHLVRVDEPLMSVEFSPDGDAIACGGGRIARLLDARTGAERRVFSLGEPVRRVSFSRDGRMLAVAGGDWRRQDPPGLIAIWDVDAGRKLKEFRSHKGIAWAADFSLDGRLIASGGGEIRTRDVVIVRDVATGQVIATLGETRAGIGDVAFSGDGRFLACAGGDCVVRVWEVGTWKQILALEGHTDVIWAIAFSPDSRLLASGGRDESVRVWDMATGDLHLEPLYGHTQEVRSIMFSPDASRLASAGSDRTIRLWDTSNGLEALTLRGHDAGVCSLAFSPDGRSLATASDDRTVRVWTSEPASPAATAARAPLAALNDEDH